MKRGARADVLGELLLQRCELAPRKRELLPRADQLSLVAALLGAELVALAPDCREVEPEADGVLAHAVEVGLEVGHAPEDVAPLVLQQALLGFLGVERGAQRLDLACLARELRLQGGVVGLGRREVRVDARGTLRQSRRERVSAIK